MKNFYTLTPFIVSLFFSVLFILPVVSPAQDLAETNSIAKNYNPNKNSDLPISGNSSANHETRISKDSITSHDSSSKQTITPSLWAQEEDQVNGRINKSKLTKMKNATDVMISFLHDSCIAGGSYNPVWHGEYFSEKEGFGPLMRFGMQCDLYQNKAHLTIMANDLSPLLDNMTVNGHRFLTIKAPIAVSNDNICFEYTAEDGMRTKTWLITGRADKLPYAAVTRREYLQEARQELTGMKNGAITDLKEKMPVRPVAVQEADKKATIEQLNNTYSGLELQVRMKMFLKNYKSDEDYLKENIDAETAGLESTLHVMDSLATHLSADELNKPAIVSVQASGFTGFEDARAGRNMLIKMNPSFINPYLTGEKAQLFLVSWKYDPSEAIAKDLDKQINERFDGQVLKNMLEK